MRCLMVVLALTLLVAACGGAATPAPLAHIRLPMGFIPSVQFAPFYVAVERGYFREAGIEVEFDYSFETDGVKLVGAGELPFAIVSGDQVVQARAQGAPLVYVMAWFQQYPIAVVARGSLGIASPADLKGRRVGLPGEFGATYVGWRALLLSAGLKPEDVTLDSIGFNQVAAFTAGQEDVVVGYANNEPIQLRAAGEEISTLHVADYAALASNGIVTNEKTIAENPELVRGMVGAALKGLSDAIGDPDAAYEICKAYVEGLAAADERVQKQVLAASIEMWQAPTLGLADAEAWENTQNVLLEMGLISAPIDLSRAYTNEFVLPGGGGTY